MDGRTECQRALPRRMGQVGVHSGLSWRQGGIQTLSKRLILGTPLFSLAYNLLGSGGCPVCLHHLDVVAPRIIFGPTAIISPYLFAEDPIEWV